jgi:hypothetical protein
MFTKVTSSNQAVASNLGRSPNKALTACVPCQAGDRRQASEANKPAFSFTSVLLRALSAFTA